MNKQKKIAILKKVAVFFVTGTAITAALLAIITSFVCFPVGVAAITVVIGGVVVATIMGVHAGYKYDADLKKSNQAEARDQAVEKNYRALHLQVADLKRHVKRLNTSLAKRDIELVVMDQEKSPLSEHFLKGSPHFFKEPVNDAEYAEEKIVLHDSPR